MMSAPLRWDDLQFFDAVVAAGSISGAAARLGVNHSTVLRRIGSLEAALAVRLFDRLPGGYVLTAPGQLLAERLGGLGEQIDGAERSVKGHDEAIEGTIRITSTDTLVHGLLMAPLALFRARHPRVQLQLAVNNSFLSLTRREADVAVRGSNRPPENLIGRRVGQIRSAPYASPAYLERIGAERPLAQHEWVAPDDSLAHLEQAKWLRQHVEPSRIVLQVDSLVGMVDAVAAGIGAGWLLCPLGDARPGLQRLAPPEPALDTQVWILTHPDLRQVARIRHFTQFLFESLSSDPRLDHA